MTGDETRSSLRWFRLFMLMHVALRSFLTAGHSQIEHAWHDWVLYGQVLVSLLGFLPGATLHMTRLAAIVMVGQVAVTFPLTANHVYLEAIILGFLALLDERDTGERVVLLNGLRWLTMIFFFITGLQKLLYGTYFDGQFLGFATATEGRFASFFRHLLPPEEFRRLRALGPSVHGAGPYRIEGAPLALVVSNATYLFEMMAPVLLGPRATRVAAALASIAFIVLIEAAAREIVFGAMMMNLLLLFLPGWSRRLFPLFAAGYAYLAAAKLGAVPMVWYAL